jgi:thioredoxin-related protein
VGGNWCTWCRKFDKIFEENEDANTYLRQKFLLVKINFSPDNRNKEVLSRFPVISGYPHLFVLDNSGKLIHSQNTAEWEKGDTHDREKVFQFLKNWAPDVEV